MEVENSVRLVISNLIENLTLTNRHVRYVESLARGSIVGMKSNPDDVLWCNDSMGPCTTAVYQWVAKLFRSREHDIVLGASWRILQVKLPSKANLDAESTRHLYVPRTLRVYLIPLGIVWGADCSSRLGDMHNLLIAS